MILTVNAGSSSLKFSIYSVSAKSAIFDACVHDIGSAASGLRVKFSADGAKTERLLPIPLHADAVAAMLDFLREAIAPSALSAIGHRFVHGGPEYYASQVITPRLTEALHMAKALAPAHMPAALDLLAALQRAFPQLRQIACFDTAFHRSMPSVAQLLALPRQVEAQGLRRFGFHGLSCAYLCHALEAFPAGQGRAVLAHLGSGASITAVQHGRSMDTSMGLTPAGGIPMATRCGDIDPGLMAYLARQIHMNIEQSTDMLNHRSGLLGVSGISGDMQTLLACEARDAQAAQAIALFCYQVRKTIAAQAAALEGIDTLVFSGGIGEAAASVRARVCAGLGFLGIALDPAQNAQHAALISAPSSAVCVRVIAANEQWTLARETFAVLRTTKD